MIIINASIDLTKLDKTKIIEGQKGKYYNLTIIVKDEKDQFDNDCSIYDKQTKDERLTKKEKKYLGNGRVIIKKDNNEQKRNANTNTNGDFSWGTTL